MQKVNNKGFSMVEILISIAIFAILMMPIVSGIISSMKNTTRAKDLQYRNEFAENVVEYVKQDSLENVLKGDYFKTIGSYTADPNLPINAQGTFYYDPTVGTYDSSLKKFVNAITQKYGATKVSSVQSTVSSGRGSNKKYYPFENYMITGQVKLGSKDTVYSYKMQISNEYYANKEKGGSYVNPNNLALGIVEDIDYTQVALINGTIANYDESVSNAFLTKKIEVLKEKDPTWYDVYKNQQNLNSTLFPDDTAMRVILVKVSGKASTGYKVTCSLKYHDNCETNATVRSELSNYYIEYMPFEYNYEVDSSTGVATLPSIYLMYNACLYNGQFSKDDFIVLDTTELTDDTPVDFFIVQTAETYSSDLRAANPELADGDSTDASGNPVYKKLYNNNLAVDTVTRSMINVHLGAKSGSKLSNVSVYHNFDEGTNTDINHKSKNILYKDDNPAFYTAKFSSAAGYQPLINTNSSDPDIESVLRVAPLNKAQQESRGLYQIKLWMEETSDINEVDVTKSPIITATKGGDES